MSNGSAKFWNRNQRGCKGSFEVLERARYLDGRFRSQGCSASKINPLWIPGEIRSLIIHFSLLNLAGQVGTPCLWSNAPIMIGIIGSNLSSKRVDLWTAFWIPELVLNQLAFSICQDKIRCLFIVNTFPEQSSSVVWIEWSAAMLFRNHESLDRYSQGGETCTVLSPGKIITPLSSN